MAVRLEEPVLMRSQTAELVLEEFLTPEQKEEYRKTYEFTVDAPSGRRYRVGFDKVVELDEADEGVVRFCAHPTGPGAQALPPADITLTKLLWLLTDEEGFRKRAGQVTLGRQPFFPLSPPPQYNDDPGAFAVNTMRVLTVAVFTAFSGGLAFAGWKLFRFAVRFFGL